MTRVWPFLALILIGAAWGGTQPLSKVAVSDGYRHFGLIFWQVALSGAAMAGVTVLRGRGLPLHGRALRLYLVVGLVGSVFPGITAYQGMVHLPSGVMSILIAAVPLVAFPLAMALGMERLRPLRMLGLLMGLAGVALLVVPENGLPPGVDPIWVLIVLLGPVCYAIEGNYVALNGTEGMDPVQVLTGASFVAALASLPLALLTGQFILPHWPLGAPDLALLASTALHTLAYGGYVWLIGFAGSVFAAQVAYLVTLFGICWAMLFLGEGYSGWVWAALAVMLSGVALVQPRPASDASASKAALAPEGDAGQNANV